MFQSAGHVIIWPFRWLAQKTSKYSEFWVAFSTIWIAIFTIVLALTSVEQWRTLQTQSTEAAKEFAATERARMVLGNNTGEIMEFGETSDSANLKLFLRNIGHTLAHEVTAEIWPLVTPPAIPFPYPPLSLPNTFLTGPTISEGEPYNPHIAIDRKQESQIRQGQLSLRIIGRIRYWDDFGHYCEPFAVIYINKGMVGFTGTPEFMPSLVSPMICSAAGPYGETFGLDKQGQPVLSFQMPRPQNPVKSFEPFTENQGEPAQK